MELRTLALSPLLFVLSACSLSAAQVYPVASAPTFPPSPDSSPVAVVEAPPPNSDELGAVKVYTNATSNDNDCRLRIASEARKLGGDKVLYTNWNVGSGRNCRAVVYRTHDASNGVR